MRDNEEWRETTGSGHSGVCLLWVAFCGVRGMVDRMEMEWSGGESTQRSVTNKSTGNVLERSFSLVFASLVSGNNEKSCDFVMNSNERLAIDGELEGQ